MLDNFNVNVTHFVPTPAPETGGGAPDTGFFSGITSAADFVSNNSAIIAIIISLLVTALAVFFFRRKLFSGKRLAILPSLAIFAFMAGFSYAAYTTINSVEAKKGAVAKTTIDITMNPEQETTKTGVTTAEVTLSPEELENAIAGYTVYAYLDTATDTNLSNADGVTISATDTNVSDPEDLEANTYAIYDIENNTYTAISTDEEHPTKVYFTDQNSTEGSTFNVYYAAKVDNTLPEGNYAYDEMAQQLTYVTKVNPITFDMAYAAAGKTKDATTGLYRMQDMTTEICSAVSSPTSTAAEDTQTTTLVDIRDGKTYTVAKLLDDSCWMTQNLALGDASGITNLANPADPTKLTPEDTDLNDGLTSFTIPSSDAHDATGSDWNDSYDNPEFAYYTSLTDPDNYGNYYNWPAAAAGTTVNSGDTSSSICPKGWKLPTTNGGAKDNTNQFYKLMSNYVSGGTWSSSYWGDVPTTNFIGSNTGISLMFSGYYISTSVNYQGSDGYWWSSTAYNSVVAYYLGVTSSGSVYPAGNNGKDYGLSVRCVAAVPQE